MLERTQPSRGKNNGKRRRNYPNDVKINSVVPLYPRKLLSKFGKDRYRQMDARAHTSFAREVKEEKKEEEII